MCNKTDCLFENTICKAGQKNHRKIIVLRYELKICWDRMTINFFPICVCMYFMILNGFNTVVKSENLGTMIV